MNAVINYIIEFLLGEGNKELTKYVSYGECEAAKIIIAKSDFFEEGYYMTPKSMPQLPLKCIDDMPILYGENVVTHKDGKIYIGADLVASTFFMISRYEECINRDIRDSHGRYIGKESLLYRAGLLQRPIVDEYRMFMQRILKEVGLKVIETPKGINHIYLTHDVDQIWTWDSWVKAMRSTAKRFITNQPRKLLPIMSFLNYKKYDPSYTFPQIIQWDKQLMETFGKEKCEDIYFFMGCKSNESVYDIAYWKETGQVKAKDLVDYLKYNGSKIGLHISYGASIKRHLMLEEKELLEKEVDMPIYVQRNHFLASREPEDFQVLDNIGIEEDFTMGYADIVGFRLGTCHKVRWINPITRQLTNLILHPMTIMECTLDGKDYMDEQNEEVAFHIVKTMLDTVKQYNGEVVLLWHNTSILGEKNSYQTELYKRTLEYLSEMK